MNTTFVRNSFVSPCCLAFCDKTPAAASNGARLDSISFSYNHGAPSYPGDVLANCSMHGYIPALDNGIAPESQSFALAISGRVDDQAIVSVDSNDTYASPSGAGVTLDGEITAVGAGYHSLYVKHINIAYPPNSNVSYINCTISGISPATPVPTDNDSEVTCTSTCPCSCSNGATEVGGQGGAARDTDAFSSTSGGSEVSRSATANTMSWSCKFGSFRGVAGLPSARLEILAHHYAATLSTPAGLAVRHPFAMFLSIPQGGIQPNQLVRLNDGASYTNYMCAGDGNYFFTVGASQTSQTLLAPVNALSLAPSAVCPLASAQYIRASYKEGHAVFFSPLTGECVAFVSKFGNVLTAADALTYFAIVRAGQSGVIRQVWNLWDGLADIVPNESTGGYSIAIYPPDQVTPPAQEGGLFTVTGNPVKTFAVSGDAQTQSLTIAERDWTLPESMPDFVYSWNYAGNAWSTVTGEGDDSITETRTRTELQDNEYTVETILSKGGEESSHTVERYAATDVGKRVVQSSFGVFMLHTLKSNKVMIKQFSYIIFIIAFLIMDPPIHAAETIIIEEVAEQATQVMIEGGGVGSFYAKITDEKNRFDPDVELTDTYTKRIFVAGVRDIEVQGFLFCNRLYVRCANIKTGEYWFCWVPEFNCKNHDIVEYSLCGRKANSKIRKDILNLIVDFFAQDN